MTERKPYKIFTHYDTGDPMRMPVHVCVCIGNPNHDGEIDNKEHVHMIQTPEKVPTTDDGFWSAKTNQIVLSVSDLPVLLKEIKQAVKELKEGLRR